MNGFFQARDFFEMSHSEHWIVGAGIATAAPLRWLVRVCGGTCDVTYSCVSREHDTIHICVLLPPIIESRHTYSETNESNVQRYESRHTCSEMNESCHTHSQTHD